MKFYAKAIMNFLCIALSCKALAMNNNDDMNDFAKYIKDKEDKRRVLEAARELFFAQQNNRCAIVEGPLPSVLEVGILAHNFAISQRQWVGNNKQNKN